MNFQPAEKKNGRHHFLALDGLRGVAAFIVIFFHGCAIFGIPNVVNSAYMAVDFFFLLSGFVIAYAYDRRLGGKSMTWWQFMTTRMIRLYPMLVVGTAAGLFVFVALQIRHAEFGIVISLLAGMGSFALLPVGLVLGTIAYPVNLPVWSLFFEFSVNALYGSRFGRLGKHSLVAFVALSGAALIAVTMWGGPYFELGWANPTAFTFGFARVCYPFWAGVLLFRVARVRTLPSVPIGVIASILVVLLLVPINGSAYDLLLTLVVFPVLIAFASCANLGGSAARACSALGRLSYPLYLVHLPVFQIIGGTSRMMHLGISPWVLMTGGAGVAVAVAEGLLVAFDEPVRRQLNACVETQPSVVALIRWK
jgi:peptidoglycan/LPS O-acetylase OafA/YrhL